MARIKPTARRHTSRRIALAVPRASPAIALPPQILSELVAWLPDVRYAAVWCRGESREYRLCHANVSDDRANELGFTAGELDGHLRPALGIRCLKHQGEVPRARLVRPKFEWVPLSRARTGGGRAVPFFGVLLKVEAGGGRDATINFLVEVYVSRPPRRRKGLTLADLVAHLIGVCQAHERGRRLLSETRAALGSTSWSLAKIQSDLSVLLRSTFGPDALKELHLFLIDPVDGMLYFADTDRLSLDEVFLRSLVHWRLPPLPIEKQEYVSSRIARGGANPSISALYERMVGHAGLSGDEVRQNQAGIRAVLSFLPQEVEDGIAGESVVTKVMCIGDPTEGRWAARPSDSNRFFRQKLAVEQLFGIARGGWLVAMPVNDGPQVIGSVFVVTPAEPSRRQKLALRETAEHASLLVAHYRSLSFLRSVVDALPRDRKPTLSGIVAQHLGQVLLHRMLLVCHTVAGSERFTEVWWTPPGEWERRRDTSERVLNASEFRALLDRAREGDGIVEVGREVHEGTIGNFIPEIQTAFLIPFEKHTSFLVLLAEPVELVRRSAEKLQHVLALVETLGRLPETFRLEAENQELRARSLMAKHNLSARYVRPLGRIAEQLGRYSGNGHAHAALAASGDSIDAPAHLVEDLSTMAVLLEAQVQAFDFRLRGEGQRTLPANVDLTKFLRMDVPQFLRYLARSRTRGRGSEWFARSAGVDATGVDDGLFVFADRNDLSLAFYDILENAIKSMNPDILEADPSRGVVTVTGFRRGRNVTVTVRDRARGMSESLCRDLNDRFAFYATGQPVARAPGDGTGLHNAPYAFADVIDEQDPSRRGRLAVRSILGEGTEFEIVMPACAREPKQGASGL